MSSGYSYGTHHWPVSLRHDRVVLAPMRRRDQAVWERVRRRNAGWLKPWEATLPPGSSAGPTSYGALVRSLSRQARDDRMLPWLVFYDDQPGGPATLAGQLTVSGIVGGSASWGQIGYWVDQRLAGRGIIPTAVALAVDYCFSVMRLHRIEIAIRPENAASLRVVEKLGFRPEGMRPRYLHIDGDWRDHLVFALNAEEVGEGLVRRYDAQRTRPQQP
ncbi:GNAT family N-acetyltransferase [Microlunatus flavus]|uniref:Ribosomal-protein-alanine N-acetyltransferase n=1 Tax=Microlunatus flavus TaxID=1036181 RepID=A0A1H9K1D1_9ACTN|nr:GNAT family protein [Microlunatus flavus]SEQ92713.1 ribosomal-protein-alanine N-acetyltransferase [Microlunatus flavus]